MPVSNSNGPLGCGTRKAATHDPLTGQRAPRWPGVVAQWHPPDVILRDPHAWPPRPSGSVAFPSTEGDETRQPRYHANMRSIRPEFIMAPPTGARVRTRLRLTPADEAV